MKITDKMHLLTYSIEQSPSWEANWSAASQEISRILWNPKVHHRTHKHTPPVPILSFVSRGSISHMCFVTKILYGEELLAPCPNSKMENHPVSAVRDCLFNIFAATLLIGGRSSIRNPRTRHAVVTGTHLSHGNFSLYYIYNFNQNYVILITVEWWRGS